MVKTYKSAIDLWLAVILIGAPLAVIFTGVSIGFGLYILHWHENLGRSAGFLLVAFGIGLGGLIGAFTFPCRYTLRETELYIQCGMLNWIVPYRDICQLELSCSLWSAPALSLNRVKIVLEEGFLLVSPKNRIEFIEELKSRLDQRQAARET
jgi:hypothetical protein